LGHYEEALRLGMEALAGFERHHGMEHPETLDTLLDVAAVQSSLGRIADAEESTRRAISGLLAVRDAEHTDVLWARFRLARILTAKGEHEQAYWMFIDIHRTWSAHEGY